VTPYEQVLELAHKQAEAVRRGDLDAAVDALDARATLLLDAPVPTPSDLAAIHETLSLDRELSGAIRGRMLAIRDESLEMHRGHTALSGYSSSGPRNPVYFDRDV
jgi:hypothetical protein